MKNIFIENIKIKDFQQDIQDDDFTLPFTVGNDDINKELPLSIFLIEEILEDTEKWINQERYHYGWTIKSFSSCVLWNMVIQMKLNSNINRVPPINIISTYKFWKLGPYDHKS